jgi:mono/diheme cytochrome c family protein
MLIRCCQIALILTVIFCTLPGCGDSDKKTPPPTSPPDPTMTMMSNCSKCHVLPGESEGRPLGPNKGPSLAHVGSEHAAEWLAKFIRNSKSVRPDSKMPSFQGMIKDDELTALAEYLANQK